MVYRTSAGSDPDFCTIRVPEPDLLTFNSKGTLITPNANLAQEIQAGNTQPNGVPRQQGTGRNSVAYPSGEYGVQYNLAGWRWDINPATLNLGPHSIYAYACGCITGRETMTSVSFNVTDIGKGHT